VHHFFCLDPRVFQAGIFPLIRLRRNRRNKEVSQKKREKQRKNPFFLPVNLDKKSKKAYCMLKKIRIRRFCLENNQSLNQKNELIEVPQ